ncbi:hypothetical protein AB0N09_40000 [Streptomyces erythrochromogenes]|uniref:hypothetical protein n=1 Tax=Streptomyces erythrochromogenes TaxID=285574 RepID=UPI0034218C30
MSDQQHGTDAAQAYEHLVQTLRETAADPWAPAAEERLSSAAHAANAAMYPKNDGR